MKKEIIKFNHLDKVQLSKAELDQAKELHPTFNEDRLKQWLAGRKLLQSSIKELTGQEVDLFNLEQNNYHNLKYYPELVCSISHSKTSIGCYLTYKAESLNVGLDIESKDREIRVQGRKYFYHPADKFPDWIRTEERDNYLWSIKESCFKTLFPFITGESPFVLSDIWINSQQFGILESSEVLGEWSEQRNEKIQDHYIITSKITLQKLKSLKK